MNPTIVQALTITYQYLNQAVLDVVLEEMAGDLAGYPEAEVLLALKRCRTELKALKFSDILDRLPTGHPGPEEAWALVAPALDDEARSIAWTREMAEAFGTARHLARDPIAARMAFREVYTRLVAEARVRRQPPTWRASLGYDQAGREAAVREADRRMGRELAPLLERPAASPLTLALSQAARDMPDGRRSA